MNPTLAALLANGVNPLILYVPILQSLERIQLLSEAEKICRDMSDAHRTVKELLQAECSNMAKRMWRMRE